MSFCNSQVCGKLLLPDNRREIASVECTVTLREPSRSEHGEWHGIFIITGNQKEFQKVHLEQSEFILRLTDGREGRIIITNIPVSPDGIGTVSFQGPGSLEIIQDRETF